MSGPRERTVRVNGQPCRVWELGRGEPLGFLAGYGGLTQWPPVLSLLAERRRVIVPSLPGFPGALGHDLLDTHLDWLLATFDLLEQAGLAGADLVGVSVGGALAADVAACWPGFVRRLVLLSPLGLFDPALPTLDVSGVAARALPETLCVRPQAYLSQATPPPGADALEWQIVQTRAMEAASRLLWPLGDTRLARRLGRIQAPTLIVWGAADRVVPPQYAQRFAQGIGGRTRVIIIPNAGHLAGLDEPELVARAVLRFVEAGPAAAQAARTTRAKKPAPRSKAGRSTQRKAARGKVKRAAGGRAGRR